MVERETSTVVPERLRVCQRATVEEMMRQCSRKSPMMSTASAGIKDISADPLKAEGEPHLPLKDNFCLYDSSAAAMLQCHVTLDGGGREALPEVLLERWLRSNASTSGDLMR